MDSMKSEINDFYSLYKKVRKFIVQSTEGDWNPRRVLRFVESFMLQMTILWIIQERGFFDGDKNYFISKFKEVCIQRSLNGFKTYFEFLLFFFITINDHINNNYYEDAIVGKIIIPKPVILLKISTDIQKISIPNECFLSESKKKPLGNIPLFNLLRNNAQMIDGFILGGIYENLTVQKEKKRLGIYYTPEKITSYSSKYTIESYLLEKVNEKFNTDFESIDSILDTSDIRIVTYLITQLQSVRILDPAVGTGHFLESAIKILTEIHVKIWRLVKKLSLTEGLIVKKIDNNGNLEEINLLEISDEIEFKFQLILHLIRSKNVYGVDINPDVLQIAQIRLFLLLAKYATHVHQLDFLSHVSFNLKVGNSLLGFVQFDKDTLVKQRGLDSYLTEIKANSSCKSLTIHSELREYLKKLVNALNVDLDVITELEELKSILTLEDITHQNIRKALKVVMVISEVLMASTYSPNSILLNGVLIKISDMLKAKLDRVFSEKVGIEIKKLLDAKIFHWILEFPNIFIENGGFDVVLANPPYLGESGSKELFRIYAKTLPEYYEGKMDLWYLFIQRSLNLMVPDAYSSFITSSYWITATGAAKLRARMLSATFIVQYINFGENKVFNTAQGVHINIITFKKSTESNKNIKCILFDTSYSLGENLLEKLDEQNIFWSDQRELVFENWDRYFHFLPKEIRSIINHITEKSGMLKDSGFYVKEGIVTGLNKLSKHQIRKFNFSDESMGDGVFILDEKNSRDVKVINSLSKMEQEHLKPFFKNSDISKYHTTVQTTKNILYINRHVVDLDNLPNIKTHLEKFREPLNHSLDNPPFINRPRTQKIFTSPKIITPQRSLGNSFAYNSLDWYAGQDVYFILSTKTDSHKLKSLLLVLNSKLAYFWFYWMGKRKGKQLELFGEPLGFFPIPSDFKDYLVLSYISDYLLLLYSINHEDTIYQQIRDFFERQIGDTLVYELYFKEEFYRSQSDSTPLLKIISKYLKPVDYDQWSEYQMKKREEMFQSDNKMYLNTISEAFKSLKRDQLIQTKINEIKSHPWVQLVDRMI